MLLECFKYFDFKLSMIIVEPLNSFNRKCAVKKNTFLKYINLRDLFNMKEILTCPKY